MLYPPCLGRAKKHPNKTADMDEAILVFEKWMLNYKKTKANQLLVQLTLQHKKRSKLRAYA